MWPLCVAAVVVVETVVVVVAVVLLKKADTAQILGGIHPNGLQCLNPSWEILQTPTLSPVLPQDLRKPFPILRFFRLLREWRSGPAKRVPPRLRGS